MNLLDPSLLSTDFTRMGDDIEIVNRSEVEVIRLYFGPGGEHPLTPAARGPPLERTRERVRQINEKAIRRLKHTSRSKILKTYPGK